MSVNKVILVGRLGQNPEVRYTPSGAAVANFSVATNESWTDKSGQKQERTEWHKVVVWGKLAELCSQYLTKGRQAYIEGRMQTREWQDKDGQKRWTTEVQAQTVQFLGGDKGAGRDSGADMGAAPTDSGYDQGHHQNQGQGQAYGGQGGGNPSANNHAASAPRAPQPAGNPSGGAPSFTEDDIPF